MIDLPQLPGGKVLQFASPTGILVSIPLDSAGIQLLKNALSGILVAHSPLALNGSGRPPM